MLDLFAHIDAKDRSYFRSSPRGALRHDAGDVLRRSRCQARSVPPKPDAATGDAQAQPYLGGDAPDYADYIVFGGFQWARCISELQLLATDDPIAAWRQRLLDAFDGLAGKAKGYPC